MSPALVSEHSVSLLVSQDGPRLRFDRRGVQQVVRGDLARPSKEACFGDHPDSTLQSDPLAPALAAPTARTPTIQPRVLDADVEKAARATPSLFIVPGGIAVVIFLTGYSTSGAPTS